MPPRRRGPRLRRAHASLGESSVFVGWVERSETHRRRAIDAARPSSPSPFEGEGRAEGAGWGGKRKTLLASPCLSRKDFSTPPRLDLSRSRRPSPSKGEGEGRPRSNGHQSEKTYPPRQKLTYLHPHPCSSKGRRPVATIGESRERRLRRAQCPKVGGHRHRPRGGAPAGETISGRSGPLRGSGAPGAARQDRPPALGPAVTG